MMGSLFFKFFGLLKNKSTRDVKTEKDIPLQPIATGAGDKILTNYAQRVGNIHLKNMPPCFHIKADGKAVVIVACALSGQDIMILQI